MSLGNAGIFDENATSAERDSRETKLQIADAGSKRAYSAYSSTNGLGGLPG